MRSQNKFLSPAAAIGFFAFGVLMGCGGDGSDAPDEPGPADPTCSVDCATLVAPPCKQAVCNDGSLSGTVGECVMVSLEDGVSCDDGDRCTLGDACTNGACTSGTPKDCSGMDAACTIGVCDPADGSCKAQATNEGDPCDDGDACSVGDKCVEGACESGEAKDCSGLDSACAVGVCDPNEGACVASPVADGISCDDGDSCTVGDTCRSGSCRAGPPMDCSELDSACAAGACDPVLARCVVIPANDAAACDDGNPCTLGDFCMGGSCHGVPRNCSGLDAACAMGVCNPADGTCGFVARNDGTACDEIDLCAASGVCMEGACVGGDRVDCSSLDSECTAGVCDPLDGGCKAVPANEGAPCSSGGDACTVATTCTAGVCGGGHPPACSLVEDGCCPAGCMASNDADCSSCPGEEIAGNCVYMPTTASSPDKTSAQAACTGLGAGWGLCPPSVLCLPAAVQYLNTAGCSCGGGSAACACSSTQNLYIHVDNGLTRAHYVRDTALFPSCISGSSCTASTSESCGTALCCRAL